MSGDKGRDMFLKVTTARQGVIKGESNDEKHAGEIDILGWSWGMNVKSSSSSIATGKATMNELLVRKTTDGSSTALMAALRNNEAIKKAVLTVRKAGKLPLEYFTITIESGRITAMDIATADDEAVPRIAETLRFSFQKITIDYVPQGPDGQPRGGMVFATETVEP